MRGGGPRCQSRPTLLGGASGSPLKHPTRPPPGPRRVLPEPPQLHVPREAAAGLAWHPPALYARYDAWRLARRARKLFHAIAPQVRAGGRAGGLEGQRAARCVCRRL